MAKRAAIPDLVDLVQHWNEARSRGDSEAWVSVCSPDIVVRPIPTLPTARSAGVMTRCVVSWRTGMRHGRTTSHVLRLASPLARSVIPTAEPRSHDYWLVARRPHLPEPDK